MLPHDTYLDVIKKTPLVSIDLIIQNEQGEVLLGLRRNQPARGSWFVPGGVIKKDQSLQEALAVISERELGFPIHEQDTTLRGVFEHHYATNFAEAPDITTHYVVIARNYTLPTAQEIVSDDQHEHLQWWSPDALLASNAVHQNTKAYFQ